MYLDPQNPSDIHIGTGIGVSRLMPSTPVYKLDVLALYVTIAATILVLTVMIAAYIKRPKKKPL